MNNFINHNYICAGWENKIGIHYRHQYKHRKTIKCFVVKIPAGGNYIKTLRRCETKDEAEALFLENIPDWGNKPIPYYEYLSKGYKSYK